MPAHLFLGHADHGGAFDLVIESPAKIARLGLAGAVLQFAHVLAADAIGRTQADDVFPVQGFIVTGAGDHNIIRHQSHKVIGVFGQGVFVSVDDVSYINCALLIKITGGFFDQRCAVFIEVFYLELSDPFDQRRHALSALLQAVRLIGHDGEHSPHTFLAGILLHKLLRDFFIELCGIIQGIGGFESIDIGDQAVTESPLHSRAVHCHDGRGTQGIDAGCHTGRFSIPDIVFDAADNSLRQLFAELVPGGGSILFELLLGLQLIGRGLFDTGHGKEAAIELESPVPCIGGLLGVFRLACFRNTGTESGIGLDPPGVAERIDRFPDSRCFDGFPCGSLIFRQIHIVHEFFKLTFKKTIRDRASGSPAEHTAELSVGGIALIRTGSAEAQRSQFIIKTHLGHQHFRAVAVGFISGNGSLHFDVHCHILIGESRRREHCFKSVHLSFLSVIAYSSAGGDDHLFSERGEFNHSSVGGNIPENREKSGSPPEKKSSGRPVPVPDPAGAGDCPDAGGVCADSGPLSSPVVTSGADPDMLPLSFGVLPKSFGLPLPWSGPLPASFPRFPWLGSPFSIWSRRRSRRFSSAWRRSFCSMSSRLTTAPASAWSRSYSSTRRLSCSVRPSELSSSTRSIISSRARFLLPEAYSARIHRSRIPMSSGRSA